MLPFLRERNHSGAHTAEDIDRALDAARDVLRQMGAGGRYSRSARRTGATR
jgi:hypothetical protein